MDKHSFASNQQKSCCEKLFSAVRNTSPFIRPMRFTKQQHHEDAANHTTAPSAKVSLKDRCVRVPRVETVAVGTPPNVSLATTNLKDRCPRVSKQSVGPPAADTKTQAEAVAVIQDHKGSHSHASSTTINQAKHKATILPIHGHENKFPTHVGGSQSYIAQSINGMSSEYIDRAGKKIRSPTNVGVQKPSITRDSFNDRVNDFINRTKNNFYNAPSFIDGSEGKEKRLK